MSSSSAYGSKTSTYSSTGASCSASLTRSASVSGIVGTTGSTLVLRMMSLSAPSCAPATQMRATSRSSNEIACDPASPDATASSVSRNDLASSATSCASWVSSDIDLSPSLERATEGHLVGVLQVAPHGQTACQPCDPKAHRLDQTGEVRRRRLALQVGVGGEDQLGHRPVLQPHHQLPHPQVVRSDALDRRDRAAQHVVAAAELARLLDRDDVLRLLDHADDGEVAPRVAADPALLGLGDVPADPAEPHLVLDLGQRVHQPLHVGRVGG